MAAYTIADVLTAAREILKDTNKVKWSDDTLLVIARQGIQLIYRELAMLNPDMFASTQQIDTVAGTSAYNLPADFFCVISISRGAGYEPLNKMTSVKYLSTEQGEPSDYWITGFYLEGSSFAQLNLYKTPDKVYAYYIRYVPVVVVTATTDSVPLPVFCRELLEDWVIKMALLRDEYSTVSEDEKVRYVRSLVSGIGIIRSNPIEVEYE